MSSLFEPEFSHSLSREDLIYFEQNTCKVFSKAICKIPKEFLSQQITALRRAAGIHQQNWPLSGYLRFFV